MNFETLTYEKCGNIATVTLNRPDKLNAMNDAMLNELDQALDQIEADDEVKVVIFKGAGSSFSVGRDMSGVGTSEVDPTELPTDVPGQISWYQRLEGRWSRIANLAKNTIAQVHGHCLDSGCWLALCCQLCIADEDARFGEPAIKIGQITPIPLWAHLIGLKRAADILYTGRVISGREAERIGLIVRAAPAGEVQGIVDAIVNEMASIAMDGQVGRLEGFEVGADVFGLASAWKLFATAHEWSISNRPEEDEVDFYKMRREKGLKAAIKSAASRFSE